MLTRSELSLSVLGFIYDSTEKSHKFLTLLYLFSSGMRRQSLVAHFFGPRAHPKPCKNLLQNRKA